MEVMNFNISGVEVLGESNEEVSLYRKQCEASSARHATFPCAASSSGTVPCRPTAS